MRDQVAQPEEEVHVLANGLVVRAAYREAGKAPGFLHLGPSIDLDLRAIRVSHPVVDAIALEYRLEQGVSGDDREHNESLCPEARQL